LNSLYEVPVNIELDEESMCVYIKVFAQSIDEAARKAVAIATDEISIFADEDNAVKIN